MTLSKWNLENKMSNLLRLVACLFVLLSFNAFAVDTDGDGFSDADEATLGTDPNDPTSPLENKLTASDGARVIIWLQRLDRRRYGCDWCLVMMTMATTQVRPMCMCAVMACGVSSRS